MSYRGAFDPAVEAKIRHGIQKVFRHEKKGINGEELLALLGVLGKLQDKEPEDNECPCHHFPSCPYRQKAERLEKLNNSLELRLQSFQIEIEVLKKDNQTMMKSMDDLKSWFSAAINKRDEKINNLETEVAAGADERDLQKEKISQLEADIKLIKNKME